MSTISGASVSPSIPLAEQIDYQAGAVVSKTILKNPGGTVTLFAFDTGQNLSEHTTPFDALVMVLDGDVELVIGGEKVSVSSGAMAVIPANIPHAVNAGRRFKMLLTMIRPQGAAAVSS
jgi:quercetin dioxygenase-like cupin family protein